MNKISTLVVSAILALNIFSTTTAIAQTPVFKFCKPHLKSGTDKEEGAVYFFDKVYTTHSGFEVDAYVTLKKLVNGAVLTNIDDSTIGYYNAWQPTVTGNPAIGSSQIDWEIQFITNSGTPYTFTDFEFAAIDVDGDGAYVREFVEFQNYSLYYTPAGITSAISVTNSLLTISGSGVSGGSTTVSLSQAMGPIANRPDIDTSSLDVKINYLFTHKSKFTMSTGVKVEGAGGANSRFFSIYPIDAEALAVLPVKITSFDAYSEGVQAILKWNTEQEVNNDHFEVERSFDNQTFTTAGIIMDGFANANGSKAYGFKDASAGLSNHSVVYYRLKQVDVNGNVSYSATRTVRFSTKQSLFTVSPNPYVEMIKVNFNADQNGNAVVTMLNLEGKQVASLNANVIKGANNITLNNLSKLQPGVYVVTIKVDGKIIGTQKVIK